MNTERQFRIGGVTRFYIPLLLQAFSQSLSYPLVGGIVTHGELGVSALSAFALGLSIMFMIGSIGGGLVMTGMVYALDWNGYKAFRRLNFIMMGSLLILQCLPAISPLDIIIFEGLLNLPRNLAQLARWTMIGGLVMNAAFFLRNVPMVVLFNNLQSGKANTATMIRIGATLLMAIVFPKFGLVGIWWGLIALTAGVLIELLITWVYARPYVLELSTAKHLFPWRSKIDDIIAARHRLMLVISQLKFTLPLSLGSFLLAASPLVLAAFVGRSADAQVMLAIHYVTMGVANPVGFAGLRIQAVSIAFPPAYKGDVRMLWYAIGVGLMLGLILLVFSTPVIADNYFGVYQNVKPIHLAYARGAIAAYCLWPMLQAIRARIEGIAAVKKRPSAVMAGQIAYLASMVVAMSIMLRLNVIGWQMSVLGIYCATICTILAVYAVLNNGEGNKR